MNRYTIAFEFENNQMVATIFNGQAGKKYRALRFMVYKYSEDTTLTAFKINGEHKLFNSILLSTVLKPGIGLSLPPLKELDKLEVQFKGQIAGLTLVMEDW
jgi:hypothetical protein